MYYLPMFNVMIGGIYNRGLCVVYCGFHGHVLGGCTLEGCVLEGCVLGGCVLGGCVFGGDVEGCGRG